MRSKPILCAIVSLAACTSPTIEQRDVERIITTLAADDMQGRSALTPAADRAAEFIRHEFEEIGLEPLAGERDLMQRFPIFSVRVADARVVLDGAEVGAEEFVARVADEVVRWSTPSDVEFVSIGASDDASAAMRAVFSGAGNRLVFVHPTHQQLFEAYRRFLSRPATSLERVRGPNVVAVLRETVATTFSVSVRAAIMEHEAKNVVGVIPGRRSDEFVIFSAHYDHVGIVTPTEGDSIANGANDDASGTTGVIALARYLGALASPERTLIFVAFTAEEIGGYGSRHFSNAIDPERVMALFNIEMIGKPGKDGPNSAWITGFDRSSFGTILQDAVEGTPYQFYPDPYPTQRLFYRSDNATLARLGVPAHSISTTPIDVDPDYHEVTDLVRTLELEHLTATIRAIATGSRTIVSGEATPTRVDTTELTPRR